MADLELEYHLDESEPEAQAHPVTICSQQIAFILVAGGENGRR